MSSAPTNTEKAPCTRCGCLDWLWRILDPAQCENRCNRCETPEERAAVASIRPHNPGEQVVR